MDPLAGERICERRLADDDGVARALDQLGQVRILRSESGPNSVIPILAFTADIDPTITGPESGFDGVVRKPIAPQALIAALVQHLAWTDTTEFDHAAHG